MIPILASNFGNLYAFMFGVVGAALGLLLAGLGFGFRNRICHVVASATFLGTGYMLLRSLSDAMSGDIEFTRICAWIAFAFAALAAAFAIVARPRGSLPASEKDQVYPPTSR